MHELGLYDESAQWKSTPYEVKFAAGMWNSPTTEFPKAQWLGGSTGFLLGDIEYTDLSPFFLLFWPASLIRHVCNMTNLYTVTFKPDGKIWGGRGWRPVTPLEFKVA